MKSKIYKQIITLGCVGVLLAGCAREVSVPEGYVDIDTDISDDGTDEFDGSDTVTDEELHVAEAVPYTGDKDEDEGGEDAKSDTATDIEDALFEGEYLPGYATEQDYRERHTGSVSYIWEPTVIVSIFIDEEEDLWTEEEKLKALEICDIGYTFIKDTMKEDYDTDVELIYDWREDPELAYSIRIYEDIPAYVTTEQERYLDDLEAEWVSRVPYRELCEKYDTSSIGFLYLVPHEGCSYSSMHFVEDGASTWNEGSLLYLQDMYSPTYEYETPTVYAHELLHLFGAEDFYDDAEVFSDETYKALAGECEDDIMLRTFAKIDGVYTTFPDEVYGEITPVTAYLLGIGDERAIEDVPELARTEAACFPGSVYDRPF